MWSKARSIIETLYQDTATIHVMEKTVNAYGITETAPTVLYEGLPCRISNKGHPASKHVVTNEDADSGLVLYCSPDIVIPEGSRIGITRNGRLEWYKWSGRAMRYNTHQEIEIVKQERA